MKYLTFIRCSESYRASPPPAALDEAMGAFVEKSFKDGSLVDTGGLLPSKDGARVRLARGRITVTDGPFTEAKEVLGGYWMIDVKSKEEAIEWARKCPASNNEIIEIRQVQEMADFPVDVQKAARGFDELQKNAAKR